MNGLIAAIRIMNDQNISSGISAIGKPRKFVMNSASCNPLSSSFRPIQATMT